MDTWAARSARKFQKLDSAEYVWGTGQSPMWMEVGWCMHGQERGHSQESWGQGQIQKGFENCVLIAPLPHPRAPTEVTETARGRQPALEELGVS